MRHLFFMLALATLALPAEAHDPALSPAEAREIAEEVYIWGYPLVLMETTRKVMTNHETPTAIPGQGPKNQFSHAKAFPPASFRDVVRPNFDTLYSIAWLDLDDEPLVMTLPRTDRYHLFQMLDAWSEVFAVPGTRMSGDSGGTYLIAGPHWRGDTPADMELLRSPTPIVWVVGRIQTNGPDDYAFVHALQKEVSLTPLSSWGKGDVSSKGHVDATIDMKTPPMVIVDTMDGETFFTVLMEALQKNPPLIHDQSIVGRMKRLGLAPGIDGNTDQLPEAMRDAINAGAADALKRIQGKAKNLNARQNGWNVLTGAIGAYGADYLFRAAIALYGLGANRPEDAIYPATDVDEEGLGLTGANAYTLHFPAGQLPPVDAFWSLTMYDDSGFPVENSLGRHAIGDRDALMLNDDGSLTLYLQNAPPADDRTSNWLPAPKGAFTVILRCYSPRPAITSGYWVPPAVTRIR